MKIHSILDAFKEEYTSSSGTLAMSEDSGTATFNRCVLKNCGKSVLIKADHGELNWLKIVKDADFIKKKCDYVLLLKEETGSVFSLFFEMKGKNISDALRQIENTFEYFSFLSRLLRNNDHCKERILFMGVILANASKTKLTTKSANYKPKLIKSSTLKIYLLPQHSQLNIRKFLESCQKIE